MGEFLGQGSALRVVEAHRRRAREQCELEGALRSTTAPHASTVNPSSPLDSYV